ncbi:MAG: hypothetical protein APR63_01300 [Desulfuromonas sp. SDB]|nr:MAG: hypothetical protein APR63_01300 [Desulfuromonas sp. SDB]
MIKHQQSMHPYLPCFIQEKFLNNNFKGQFPSFAINIDISGFTSLTEQLVSHGKSGSEELYKVIREIFDPIILSIYAHCGFISTFSGDSLVALFILGIEHLYIPQHCISALKEISQHFKLNHLIETAYGSFPVKVRIGAAQGITKWGILSDGENFHYYFRGEAIDKSIQAEKKAEMVDYYLDNEIKQLKNLPQISPPSDLFVSTSIETRILQLFLPSEFNLWKGGEFRHVASIFIKIHNHFNHSDLQNLFEKISPIIKSRGGFFSRIEFGDKGLVFLVFVGFPVSYQDNLFKAFGIIENLNSVFNHFSIPIKSSIGVTSGLVYAGESGSKLRSELTCHGDVVNISARLAISYPRGGVFCTSEVVDQAKKYADFQYIEDNTFKGKTHSLPVYRFIRLNDTSELLLSDVQLIGRKSEFQLLKTSLDRLSSHKKFSGVIEISGDMGMGKSKLIQSLHWRYPNLDNDFNWFYIKYFDLVQIPFNGLRKKLINYFDLQQNSSNDYLKQKINDFCNHPNFPDEIKKDLNIIKNNLVKVLENHDEYSSESWLNLQQLKQLYKTFLKSICHLKPTIIILEDIQWINTEDIKFFSYLTNNIDEIPLLIIITSRDEAAFDNFKFSPETEINKIQLNPHPPEHIYSYAQALMGNENINSDLFDFIKQKSLMIPLYIEQWMIHLKQQNYIQSKNNEIFLAQTEQDLPASLDQLIISRIDSAGIEVKKLIQQASIITHRISSKILNELMGEGISNNLIIGRAVQANFLQVDQHNSTSRETYYIFSNQLIRDAAYYMQLEKERKVTHLKIITIIEKIYHRFIESWFEVLCFHANLSKDNKKLIFYLEKSADYYFKKYNYKKAADKYTVLLSNAKNPSLKLQTLLNLSAVISETGPYLKSKSYAEKALSSSKKINDFQGIIRSCYILGKVYMRMGEYEKSLNMSYQCIEFSKKYKNTKYHADAYTIIGQIYRYQSKFDRAFENFQQNLKLSEQIGDLSGMAISMINSGLILVKQNRCTQAMNYYQRAYDIAKKVDHKVLMVSALGNMGIVHFKQGYPQKFFKNTRKLIRLAQKTGNTRLEIRGYIEKAIHYARLKKFKYALNNLNRALDLALEQGDQDEMIKIYLNIGQVLMDQQKYNQSIEYLKKSLKICINSSTQENLGNIYNNLGTNYYSVDNYLDALKYYHLAFNIRKKIRVNAEESLHNIIQILLIKQKITWAKKFSNIMSDMAEENKSIIHQIMSSVNLARCHIYHKEYEKAKLLLEKTLSQSRSNKYDKWENFSIYYLAEIELNLQNINQAKELIKQLEKNTKKEFGKSFKFELKKLMRKLNQLN